MKPHLFHHIQMRKIKYMNTLKFMVTIISNTMIEIISVVVKQNYGAPFENTCVEKPRWGHDCLT